MRVETLHSLYNMEIAEQRIEFGYIGREFLKFCALISLLLHIVWVVSGTGI